MERDTAVGLLQSLFVLSSIVEARDPYTGGHLWRVSQYGRLLGERIRLTPAALGVIAVGGFLHDLGKIAVPDAVLHKPGPLTQEERDVIRIHPDVGAGLIARHPLGMLVQAAVRHHHERPDGTGYPGGLRGGEIPFEARAIAIADAFDAMTSSRPYSAALPVEHALRVIRDDHGRQFDGQLAEAFLDVAEGGLGHILAHSEPHIPLLPCPVCGPIVVVTRHHEAGARVYCRSCGAELRLAGERSRLRGEPTGRTGTAAELAPKADQELLEELAEEMAGLLNDRA